MMIIMVHGTYHPSLTGGSFIIDKTHVQHHLTDLTDLVYLLHLFTEDHVNRNNRKPVAYNKHRI